MTSKKINFKKKSRKLSKKDKKFGGVKNDLYIAIKDSSKRSYKKHDIFKELSSKGASMIGKNLSSKSNNITVTTKNFKKIPTNYYELLEQIVSKTTKVQAIGDSKTQKYKKGDIGEIKQIYLDKGRFEILVKFPKFVAKINPKKFIPLLPSKGKKTMAIKKSAIISYNLSWATQKNEVAGSEKQFVKFCQRKAVINKHTDPNLSYCTTNAANLLSIISKKYNLEIIGIQESVPEKIDLVTLYINHHSTDTFNCIHSGIYNYACSSIIFNRNLGDPEKILEGELTRGRPYIIVYFPEKEYLVINAHFTHHLEDHDYKKFFAKLEEEINKNLKKRTVSRIIFTGDFNDHKNVLNKTQRKFRIQILKKMLYCGDDTNLIPKSCCYRPKDTDTKLKLGIGLNSDYVFDTRNQSYFGVPKEYKTSYPASDHLPVIGIN